jgi:hypothetical protein
MRILRPNVEDGVQYVVKNHIFVLITDFNDFYFLTNIRIKFEKDDFWYWIPIQRRKRESVVGANDEFCGTFDHVLNRKVNDLYCSVYEFDDIKDFLDNIGNVKYIDNIKTIYQAVTENDPDN